MLIEEKKDPLENLGNAHFPTKALISIIPTFLYQYTIFQLICMLLYKKDWTEGTEEIPAVTFLVP
jgi:hypothetical protein